MRILYIFVAGLVVPGAAYAYLDPGTGSMMLQMLIAGVLGAMLYVRLAWASTKNFFVRLFSGDGPDGSREDPNAGTEGRDEPD